MPFRVTCTGEACGITNLAKTRHKSAHQLALELTLLDGTRREFLKEALAEITAAANTPQPQSAPRGSVRRGHAAQLKPKHRRRHLPHTARANAQERNVQFESRRGREGGGRAGLGMRCCRQMRNTACGSPTATDKGQRQRLGWTN